MTTYDWVVLGILICLVAAAIASFIEEWTRFRRWDRIDRYFSGRDD